MKKGKASDVGSQVMRATRRASDVGRRRKARARGSTNNARIANTHHLWTHKWSIERSTVRWWASSVRFRTSYG